MNNGFYWVRLLTLGAAKELTVGFYDAAWPSAPWQIVGCDEGLKPHEVEVVAPIERPQE